jgi:curli biogenesis system outer membrane secretion channel CsgG
MKSLLLITTAIAILVAALAASSPLLAAPTSSSTARQAGVRILPGFRSPSGNIKCFVVRSLYCEIDKANYRPRFEASCELDWHGFQLNAANRARSYCTSNAAYNMGTERPNGAKLAYGKSFRHGVFTCLSRVTGVTCHNRTGHGLFVSRQAWRTW